MTSTDTSFSKQKPTKRELAKALSECQRLFGSALSAYRNDRSPQRADVVEPLLNQGFEICVDILGKFPREYSL